MNGMASTRNPWPLGIVVAFAIFIPATAGLIILACANRQELVSSDYYEKEIKYQGQINSLSRTHDLGTQASVIYDAPQGRLTVSLPAEHARRKAKGRILLYRASDAALDRRLRLDVDTNGVQQLDASELRPGPWKVRISWMVENQEYSLDQNVVVGSTHSPTSAASATEPAGGKVRR